MSEIKFACPHCSQHIACDGVYCGEQIDCPGCGRMLLIPPRAAFAPLPVAGRAPPPVAFKQQLYPRSSRLEVWTEEKWEQHASELGVSQRPSLLPVWVLLLLPFVAAFILVMHRARITSIEYLFILCALVTGFYLAKIQKNSGLGMILAGLLYSFGMLCAYAAMSFGLLFVGCLVALS
jgi:hypothetical protein